MVLKFTRPLVENTAIISQQTKIKLIPLQGEFPQQDNYDRKIPQENI